MLRTVLGSRVALRLDIAERPLAVEADANQFETVMVNLAANARDAMEGHGSLPVRLARSPGAAPTAKEAATGEFVTVAVIDSGCGIPPDQIDRIFPSFLAGGASGLNPNNVFLIAPTWKRPGAAKTLSFDSAPRPLIARPRRRSGLRGQTLPAHPAPERPRRVIGSASFVT